MTDLRAETDRPDIPIAPGFGGDPSTGVVPKGPAGTSPQRKVADPVGNRSGNTDSKEPVHVFTRRKP